MNLRLMLLLFAVIPMVCCIIPLTVISIVKLDTSLEESTLAELKMAAQGLRSYYEYDIQNDYNLEDGFVEYDPAEYIDEIYKHTEVNLTLFKDNIRFMTSLRNEDGTRNEGTKAGAEIWDTVRKGNEYSSTDVVIGGKDYFVYYLPIKNSEGSVVGMAFAGKPVTLIDDAKRSTMLLISGISLFLTAVFVVIALTIAPKVANPIKESADRLKDLSDGRTDITLVQNSHITETKTLQEGLRELGRNLSGISASIKQSAQGLDGSINNTAVNAGNVSREMNTMTVSMANLAEGAADMAQSVQSINNDMQVMGEIINDAGNAVSELRGSTGSMSEASRGAKESINGVTESGAESAKAIQEITESIAETNRAVDDIEEMTKLITDIASQTNLLSLNASIEAARAGEAGRGFAVVATEISKLAQDSNDSAVKIKETVSKISGLSGRCVKQAGEVRAMIESQQQLLGHASEQFGVLNSEIELSVGNIGRVSEITDQLAKIKDTVTDAVSGLSAVSEETMATNQEVVAATENVTAMVNGVADDMSNMNELSGQLKEAVSFFK